MKRKYIEMKLSIINHDIEKLEKKELSVEVGLRQVREKQWRLIEQLEKLEDE